jgi:hypothetical protein
LTLWDVLRLLLGARGKQSVGAGLGGLVGAPLGGQQALSGSAMAFTWVV